MKKKKINLSKLSFEKTVVADLNKAQQFSVKGGEPATLQIPQCQTRWLPCETKPAD
ncbi:hypothetical protein LX64_01410 [Chitinophaga skermanii]|uniref:Natural product n=1 Tax=Chitinophaga skermanii TaxID=331697 RepID=A0A327QVR8_9BACT|nr:class I lanthipeptide [Chitinophaga skermanii]RAJ08756.1 hypothetical protein LX64_01410 [Chitinophaga skermanii]